ncbi:tyrosine-protein phosphatase 10D [Trichonephila clavipes]|nr:tyrosine-protein phosphatase 10D [Trichonephila clavipes]
MNQGATNSGFQTTVQRSLLHLVLRSRRLVHAPMLTAVHQQRRLEFSHRYRNWASNERQQDGGIYQQDIAECHTTDSVRAWFKEHQDQFIVLPCPENSPDLNPINNLRKHLDRVVHAMDSHAHPIKETSSFIGIIIGVALVLVIVSVFVVGTIVLRRKGKLDELSDRLGQGSTAPSIPPEQVLQLETCATIKTLNTQNFADHVRLMMTDSHLRFSQEFEALKKNSPKFPCTAAEMEENRPKNRWLNIFPYDHSRVKLLPLGDEPGSDFVNANYIPGYSSLREYIATQGPLANTVDDLWRMIWEQSVSMIVMLTQCVERGKNKCEQYWPDAGEAKHYGDMQVRTISESMLSSYIIRLFHVQLGSQERRVKQMHFTHWPDFGCPECPDDLINFISAVRDHLPRFKPGPIIVHCSAGVGRTGTFISVDRLSQQLRNTEAIDIFGTVMELRHHRINMVQTEDQYIYIHLCIKQLVDDINDPRQNEYDDAIYSNIGMEKDTGV